MLFYKMSRKNHSIRKKPIFSFKFQRRENSVHLSEIKKMNQSEKPLQSLSVTNCKAMYKSVRVYTILYECVHFSKGEYYKLTSINAINCNNTNKKENPSMSAETYFFEVPILTPMQPYSHCSQRQFTYVTNCTKFVTFKRKRFTMKLQEKHNEFEKIRKINGTI